MDQIVFSQQTETPVFDILQQIHDGKTHIGEYFSTIFQDLPVGVVWSHLNHNKTDIVLDGCNWFAANIIGLSSPEESVGMTEFEIQGKQEDAKKTLDEVRHVVDYNKPALANVQRFCRRNGEKFLISTTKAPLYDVNKNVTGVLNIFTNTKEMKESTLARYKEISDHRLIDVYHSFCNTHNYFVNTGENVIRLTPRQAEVLTHLSMGKTVKQIANLLDCASSTVEDHIDRLKQKLETYSTSALIDCFWTNPIKWF